MTWPGTRTSRRKAHATYAVLCEGSCCSGQLVNVLRAVNGLNFWQLPIMSLSLFLSGWRPYHFRWLDFPGTFRPLFPALALMGSATESKRQQRGWRGGKVFQFAFCFHNLLMGIRHIHACFPNPGSISCSQFEGNQTALALSATSMTYVQLHTEIPARNGGLPLALCW